MNQRKLKKLKKWIDTLTNEQLEKEYYVRSVIIDKNTEIV